MKQILIAFCLLILFSCGKEKSILLPEIKDAKITEIKDVFKAYLFYNETKPDSLDLNKSNLKISTNWLVNVDKRLTLKQVIPSIIKLQEKKRSSSYKNESARNYYACNDTNIKNLGFVDFTDVVYDSIGGEIEIENTILIAVISLDRIIIYPMYNDAYEIDLLSLDENLKELFSKYDEQIVIKFSFNTTLSFQDYITFKSKFLELNIENTVISSEEYLFN